MYIRAELSRQCATSSFSEWTSNSSGWKRSSFALGRSAGSWLRHLKIKSFCCSSSRLSIVRWMFSCVTIRPESPLPCISSAAISNAHMPNEKISMAGVRLVALIAAPYSGAMKCMFFMFSRQVFTWWLIASGATLPILTKPLCWIKIVSQVRLPWMIGGVQECK